MAVVGLAALCLFGLTRPVDAATRYWIGGGANAWNTNADNLVWSTTWPDSDDVAYQEGDDVIFYRDVAAGNKTVVVQTGGVTPNTCRIDTDGTWNFSGGLIHAPLSYYPSSGGGSTLNFNGYTQSLAFTTAALHRATTAYNLAGPAGTYTFSDAPIEMLASYGGSTFEFDTSAGSAGDYTLTDDFVANSTLGTTVYTVQAAGQTHTFSGAIVLNQNLSIGGIDKATFTGTVTVNGTRTINQDLTGDETADWSDAVFVGGATSKLVFRTSNAECREHTLPSTGSRLNVGHVTFHTARIFLDPTNRTEDVFATVRGLGGGVTLTNSGTTLSLLFAQVYLRNGTYRSSDFAVGPATGSTYTLRNRLVFDTTTTNRNLILDGTFLVGGAGSEVGAVWWACNTTVPNGAVTGSMEIADGGCLLLVPSSASAAEMKLAGNLRLTDGSAMWRPTGRTVRLRVDPAYSLLLGDGSAATCETNTIEGCLIYSGGGNEAWGINADNITDDGNVVLRYEGPDASSSNPYNKYAVDWRNSTGTLQPFRGGSAGTVFAPGTLTDNDGLVCRGATPVVFTTTGRAVLETAGLMTFTENLGGGGTTPAPHTRGDVLVSGSNASFDLLASGTVAAASITITNGAGISGIGTFDSDITVFDATVAPGTSAGTLTVHGNLVLSPDSALDLELTVPGVTGDGQNDLLVVDGDLTLDGTVNVLASTLGTYTAITYTGALVDNELLPGVSVAGVIAVDVATPGEVRITLTPGGTVFMVR